MTVLVGHQIFDSQTVEGASRYHFELARHLAEAGVTVDLCVKETDNVFLHQHPLWSSRLRFSHRAPNMPKPLWKVFSMTGLDHYISVNRVNRRHAIAKLRRGAFNIFHPTYYEPYFLGHLGQKPFVMTVHDMMHELFPQYVKRYNPTSRWKRQLVDRAAHIIAVSKNTKNDLIRQWHVDPDRIAVVYHGVGAPFTTIGGQVHNGDYILFVGNRGRYKNWQCLAEAASAIVRRHSRIHFICVGGGEFESGEKSTLARLGLENKFTQIAATDEELAALYRGARMLVFPSLYEGFGLPILEAFACGCPVVLSRASCFPEVAGEAAVYFDPEQPDDLARVVNNLLDSANHQAALREAGRARAARFTWQKAAQATLKVYESCVTEPLGL